MKMTIKLIAASAMLVCAGAGFAQGAAVSEPRNVVQLSATGMVEVQQDLLVLSLATSKEAADAAAVQTQLTQALEAALAEARRVRRPDCPVGLVRKAFRPGQEVSVHALADFDARLADMLSLLIIGNNESRLLGPYMLTPRGYARKHRQ